MGLFMKVFAPQDPQCTCLLCSGQLSVACEKPTKVFFPLGWKELLNHVCRNKSQAEQQYKHTQDKGPRCVRHTASTVFCKKKKRICGCVGVCGCVCVCARVCGGKKRSKNFYGIKKSRLWWSSPAWLARTCPKIKNKNGDWARSSVGGPQVQSPVLQNKNQPNKQKNRLLCWEGKGRILNRIF